jgi:hypothetical protein
VRRAAVIDDIGEGGVEASMTLGCPDHARNATLPSPRSERTRVNYHINEASFELPDDARDQSVNTLRTGKDGEPGVKLTVQRDTLGDHDLAGFVARHTKAQSQRLRQLLLLGQRDTIVATLPAIEVRLQWQDEAGTAYEHAIFVAYYGSVVVLTASSPLKSSKECIALLSSVITTLRWRRR